jgi:hypothetical protein
MPQIGPNTGVAAYAGWSVPGFVVAFAKGKDYLVKNMPKFTQGTKFVKA